MTLKNKITLELIVLLGLCVLLFFIYSDNMKKEDELHQFTEKYEEAKKGAEHASEFADSLKTEIVIHQNDARVAEEKAKEYANDVTTLKRTTDILRKKRDSLMRETEMPKTITDSLDHMTSIIQLQDSIIDTQQETIHKQNNQIDELNISLVKKDTTIKLLTVSRDSLQTVIKNFPKTPKINTKNKTIFGIPIPSRKTMFVTGLVTGVVTTSLIVK